MLGKVGDKLIVAIWSLNEDLGLMLTLNATGHFLETLLPRLTINRQVTRKGKTLAIETRGH